MKKLTKDKISFSLLIYNMIVLATSIGYFSYALLLLHNIETLIRIIIIIIFIILAIKIVTSIIKNIFKKKKLKILIITIITTLIAALIIIIGYTIKNIYSNIDNITTDQQIYSTSIVTKIDNNINSINDIQNEKIGMLNDPDNVYGYQIPKEIISENNLTNEIIEYNNYPNLINDLLEDKIDIAFLPTNYTILFSSIEGLENISEKTKIIYTKDKNIKIEQTLGKKNLDQPFTILLMGVDSENENISGSSFNGDSLILLTFNPKTINATMLSIPRDTYTSISCFAGQKKNKITHAAWNGEKCMIKTIENMFDINIDYYVKINFKGVVNIVDSLQGIDVDVPFSFCEQNSNREFGDKMIYVNKGLQTLNGEQALALARNRHPYQECGVEYSSYNSNDFIRGQNQQLIIQGLLNKFKSIKSINTFNDMLSSISQSMETNMSTETILSFYNIGKDILIKSTNKASNLSELIGFERLYLSGYDKMIVDYESTYETGSKLKLYNFVPYKGSIKDISQAMKINLELINDEIITKYDFNINEPYEEKIIGKGKYSESGIALLPSFVGKDLNNVQTYCSNKGIKLTVNKVSTTSASLNNQVITQSLPSGMDVEFVNKNKGITVSVYEYKAEKKKEPNIENIVPGLPNTNDKNTTTNNQQNNNTNNQTQNNTTTNNPPTEINIPGTPNSEIKEETE